MTLNEAKKLFANPPLENRPSPFWFWNDHLDPKRLADQYDRLLDAGMGGAIMHARSGLPCDQYLDERWWRSIDAVVKRAHQRGGTAWLYDEYGWPSGTAAGRVPKNHPEFRMQHIKMDDFIVGAPGQPEVEPASLVAAFLVTRTDLNHGFQRRYDRSGSHFPDRIACEHIEDPSDLSTYQGQRVLLFHEHFLDGALNYFDPEAAAEFIRTTHEEYYRRWAEYFGTSIKHSFMDEAGVFSGAADLPWWNDGRFISLFQERRGYDIRPHLPALLFEIPGHESTRFDYWSLVGELFREGFGRPLHLWCKAHHIYYTGHYVFEANLKEATRQLGSCMPLYEYQGMPGIDILGNDFYSRRLEQEAYSYYVVTIKQAASVAHQLEKPGPMSESYGVGGHAMGPESMQTATNFQMALGVTHLCQHASFYSIRGHRRFDCPPFVDWRQPYWPFIRKHFDAIGRMSWLLSQGADIRKTLLLHPQASIQATYRQWRIRDEYKSENYLFDADQPDECTDKHFCLLTAALLDAQIDHDYGDEEIIAGHAQVSGAALHIGAAEYQLVVLPPLVNIRTSTLTLLQTFAASGGTIVSVGSAPILLDGRPSEKALAFIRDHAIRIVDGIDRFDYTFAITELTRLGARTITARNGEDDVPALKVRRQTWDGRDLFFIPNVSREEVAAHVEINPTVNGSLEEWDISTGETRPLAACKAGEPLTLDLHWAPHEAKTFVSVPGAPAHLEADQRTPIDALALEWTGRPTSPNLLALDECHLFHERGHLSSRMGLAQVRAFLAQAIEKAGGPVKIRARYGFDVAYAAPISSASLVLEPREDTAITLNGEPIPLEPAGSLFDPSIQRFPTNAIKAGRNILEIEATYTSEKDFPSPWLMGAFNVPLTDNPDFTLRALRDPIPVGPWHTVGLPFYAGTVTYSSEVELAHEPDRRFLLELPGLAGSAAIRVNGETVDHLLWPPYVCDVTKHVKAGDNTIEIEVANTLRNLFGPHYDPNEGNNTGPSDPTYYGQAGQPKRFLDYGLLASPTITVHRTGG